MGVIFDGPLLERVECTVKEKTFILYELSGADYWDHVLSAETFSSPTDEVPEQTAHERYKILRDNAQKRVQLVALSLQPNYPDVSADVLRKELLTMLTLAQQKTLYEALEKLMGWNDPNVPALDGDSSTG